MFTIIHFRQTALLLLLFSFGSMFAASSPVVTNLTPPNYSVNFNDVCFRDSMHGFMLTEEGLLFRSNDGGKNWDIQQKLDTMPLNEMTFVTPDTAIIIANKRIFRSIDSGKTWQNVQNIPLTGDMGTFYGAITNIGFVGHKIGFATGNGIIWKTADGGGTWKEVNFFPDFLMGMAHSFHFIDSKHSYAFAYDGNYFETTNGGDSWVAKKYSEKLYIVSSYFFNSLYGISTDGDGVVRETKNGGGAWTSISSLSNKDGLIRMKYDKSIGLIGISQNFNTCYISADSGKTWTSKPMKNGKSGLTGISVLNGKRVFVASSGGQINYSNDAGKTWDYQLWGAAGGTYSKVWFSDSLHGHALLTDGMMLNTSDGGANWQRVIAKKGEEIDLLRFASRDTGYAVSSAHLFRSYDGGKTWDSTKNSTPVASPDNIQAITNKTIYYGTDFFGTLFYSKDAGKTNHYYEAYDLNIDGLICDVSVVDSQKTYVFCTLGQIAKTIDGGQNWSRVDIPNKVVSTGEFFTSEIGIAVTGDLVYRTENGGNDWKVVLSGDLDRYVPINQSSGIVTLFGRKDSVYVTHDQGKTWAMATKAIAWGDICFVNQYLAYCTTGKNMYRIDYPRPTTGKVQITAVSDSSTLHVTASKGNSFTVQISTSDTLSKNNRFTVLLSDATGSFAAAQIIGQKDTTASCKITCIIPANLPTGTYKIKVSSSNPALEYTLTASLGVVLQQAQQINISTASLSAYTTTVTPTAGSSLTLNYTVSTNFNSGNIFTAFLSDATGNFSSAIKLGESTAVSSGTITCNIPANTASGTAYKVKLVASNPAAEFVVASALNISLQVPQTNISTASLSANSATVTPTAGSSLTLNYTVSTDFTAGNIFTAYLSDATGNFSLATKLGESTAVGNGTITCKIPANTASGTAYKIKLVASNPAAEFVVANALNISLQVPQANISTASLSAYTTTVTPTAGSSLTLNYTVSTNFNSGNTFTAYLSDATGNFSNAVKLGESTAVGNGTITCNIPANTASGTAYKIKLVASNPAVEFVIASALNITLQIPLVCTIQITKLEPQTIKVNKTLADTLAIYYTLSEGCPTGTLPTGLLSSTAGDFTTSTALTDAGSNAGIARLQIPAGLATGAAYRIKLSVGDKSVTSNSFTIDQLTPLVEFTPQTSTVIAQQGGIRICGPANTAIYISDLLGRTFSTVSKDEVSDYALPAGWYVVLIEGKEYRVFVK